MAKSKVTELGCKHISDAIKKRWQNGENLLKKAHEANKKKYLENAVYIKCNICSKIKRVPPRSKNSKHCSMKCYGISKKGKPWQENMSLFLPKGDKHYNWSGGFKRSRLPTQEDIEWRTKVFSRDDYTCQECQKKGGYLEAHHIKRKYDFPELKYKLDNGITLCYNCHKLTYFKEEKFQKKYEQMNKQKSSKIIDFNNNYAISPLS